MVLIIAIIALALIVAVFLGGAIYIKLAANSSNQSLDLTVKTHEPNAGSKLGKGGHDG